MLWGRVAYEMMESYWPAVAGGDEQAPPAMREWAVKLEAKPKYVVSSTRKDFPWANSKDKAEADRAFAILSEGGHVDMPLANAPWGPYFGMCVDRFGVHWMVSLTGPA